ncbi:MAG TPA: hypothetical protein VLF14_06515 [Candidatus Binatia bacterium]|nr:hypothetical protein [Candidatus Binatia bacterium]
MNSLFTMLREQLYGLWQGLRERGDDGYLPLLRPVGPYAGPEALSPVTMLGVMLGIVLSSGVALAALGVLLLALLVLYFLFTEVLGLTLEVNPLAF